MVAFERAGLLFVFNFHWSNSYTDYRLGIEEPGKYKVVLDSDEGRFGGHGRVSHDTEYFTTPLEWNGRKNFLQVSSCDDGDAVVDQCSSRGFLSMQVYLPTRTALVLAKVD